MSIATAKNDMDESNSSENAYAVPAGETNQQGETVA